MDMEVASMEVDEQHQLQQQQNHEPASITTETVSAMMDTCSRGDFAAVQQIASNNGPLAVSQQDEATGASPLMAAAATGQGLIVEFLLEQGAPWNAVDRQGRCAGDYATTNEHWGVVNLLVEWGTRAELILGRIERSQRDAMMLKLNPQQHQQQQQQSSSDPVSHQPSTKPDYLQHRLVYSEDGQSLLDQDKDAVMMEWERPLMQAHAQILMEQQQYNSTTSSVGKRVLNVGFGMGIIDTILQEQHHPSHHIIIEAHPDVHRRMLSLGWNHKPNVRICFGRWQDVLPQLAAREGCVVDAIFYDTYGEHALDMEDFQTAMTQILAKPGGVYSFFNGLAPDNLFFHGVACQCVQLQLKSLGLDCDFLPCQIQAPSNDDNDNDNNTTNVWKDVRRPYWHGRDTYYLPVARWNAQFLQTGQAPAAVDDAIQSPSKRKATDGVAANDIHDDGHAASATTADGKRQATMDDT